jgi:hypothetical protein
MRSLNLLAKAGALFSIVLLCSYASFADQTYTVSGTVTSGWDCPHDGSARPCIGIPVPGCTVTVVFGTSSCHQDTINGHVSAAPCYPVFTDVETFTVITDNDGKYSVTYSSALENLVYTVSASKAGVGTALAKSASSASTNAEVNIDLADAPTGISARSLAQNNASKSLRVEGSRLLLNLAQTQRLTVTAHTLDGKKIATLASNRVFAAGDNVLPMQFSYAGTMLVQVKGENVSYITKVNSLR